MSDQIYYLKTVFTGSMTKTPTSSSTIFTCQIIEFIGQVYLTECIYEHLKLINIEREQESEREREIG